MRLERPVYSVVYRWVWNSEDARDLVQEAFVRLWNMRDRVRMESVEPLVYRIAINLASNRRRKHRMRKWLSGEEAEEQRDSAAEKEQDPLDRMSVRRAIDQLPERYRRVVLLSEVAGMSYDEVGRVLSIPNGTVASRRHEAMRRLRVLLEIEEDSNVRAS